MGVGHPAVLDVEQVLADTHGDRAGGAVTDHVLLVAVLEGADRGDHRRGAAGERLGDLPTADPGEHLVDRDALLDRLEAALTRQLEDRPAGDAGQDGAGQLRGVQAPVPGDQEAVHPAELLDVAELARIEEQHLRAAVRVRLLLAGQARGVVTAALGRTGAARSGPGEVPRDPEVDRLGSLGEVRPGRRGDAVVADGPRRTHPEEVLVGDGERADVEAVLATAGRHPGGILPHQGLDRGDEILHRQGRQRQPLGRVDHPLGIRLRAEQPDGVVRVAVRLEALEDLLGVVEDRRRGVERLPAVRYELRVTPAVLHGPRGDRHVVGEVPAEPGRSQDDRALLGSCRGRMGVHVEAQAHGEESSPRPPAMMPGALGETISGALAGTTPRTSPGRRPATPGEQVATHGFVRSRAVDAPPG
ncbi:hypothetical protein SDC9_85985 [bioreactor metagenome]|uniref:Uncharacterized protein n=1 Tax=bioreactor metagenome TaxID=1076179 RepID=A0A644ZEP6_9ZZZZ